MSVSARTSCVFVEVDEDIFLFLIGPVLMARENFFFDSHPFNFLLTLTQFSPASVTYVELRLRHSCMSCIISLQYIFIASTKCELLECLP